MNFAMTFPLTRRRFAAAFLSPEHRGQGKGVIFETASCYCYISRHITGGSQGMTSHGAAHYYDKRIKPALIQQEPLV
jgi:hypothetical protein